MYTVADSDVGIDGRGLVVSVWVERDRAQGSNLRAAPTNAQKVRLFELGQYPGYGKFLI